MNYPDPNHTDLEQSIMNPSSTLLEDFTATDIKGSYIVEEENYLGMGGSDDILGMGFLDD